MNADDTELIDRKATEIAGPIWVEREVPRDWPLANQLWEIVRNARSRGPGMLESPELQKLWDLAGNAEQLETMRPAAQEF